MSPGVKPDHPGRPDHLRQAALMASVSSGVTDQLAGDADACMHAWPQMSALACRDLESLWSILRTLGSATAKTKQRPHA